jgi:hypothetical protein
MKNLPQPTHCGLGKVLFEHSRKTGKPGMRNYREHRFVGGLPVALHAGPLYNLLTAADEKIPLPVVQVNNKPQYLVFL